MVPVKVCVCLFCIFMPAICIRDEEYGAYRESENGIIKQYYKLGQFNDKCKSSRDCRHFGYVCRDNKTCQCDFMYVPDANEKTCVGGVNQRCIYDEHCIEGAYCMHQEVCKCKETTPVELDDGLICADDAGGRSVENLWIILLNVMMLAL